MFRQKKKNTVEIIVSRNIIKGNLKDRVTFENLEPFVKITRI